MEYCVPSSCSNPLVRKPRAAVLRLSSPHRNHPVWTSIPPSRHQTDDVKNGILQVIVIPSHSYLKNKCLKLDLLPSWTAYTLHRGRWTVHTNHYQSKVDWCKWLLHKQLLSRRVYIMTIITTGAVPGYCNGLEIFISFWYGLCDGSPLCADAQVGAGIFNIAAYFGKNKQDEFAVVIFG